MKRALAERAKQSESGASPAAPNGLPPVVVPSTATSSASAAAGQPPRKLPRIEEQSSVKPEQPASAPTPSPRTTSTKRQRSSPTEENDDSSGFYLKHQNRALASELKGLQYQLRLLEEERDVRRRQCLEATQALQTLETTWEKMELALQLGMPPEESESSLLNASTDANAAAIRNTGTGDSVELIGALLDSLAALGKDSSEENYKELHDLRKTASMVSQRATALQRWIWTLLQKVNSPQNMESLQRSLENKEEVSSLEMKNRELQARIAELVKTRDEAVNSDRKVRRGLYRLSAGRMKLEEVLKAVEDDDKDGSAALLAMEVANEAPAAAVAAAAATVATTSGEDTEEAVDGAQVLQLKKQIQDLDEVASSREQQIDNLLKEREERDKRITALSLPQTTATVSEGDIRRSALFTETATKLISTERQLEELRSRISALMEKYQRAKGDAELASKTCDDHLEKFNKRWAELTGDAEGSEAPLEVTQAKKIVELEHKLKQALENVRQADSVRNSLTEAHRMNDTLQQKLEEFKAKNAALVAGKSASRNAGNSDSTTKESKSTTPVSAEKSEKLHRDHRRMRKELAAALASKESAKGKQERAEKERDNLMKTNSRLLKQSIEKDDMNAKSLSTILHLKHLTEQYEQEKAILEQEAKSAGQVALAARLATNAKERVAEEALKEKKELEDKVKGLEEECERLKRDKEVADGALSQTKAEMSSLETSVGCVKDRCEELTAESAKLQEERRKLLESLAVAQRESSEAKQKLASNVRASGGGGGGASTEFTAEQLTTQVTVLKGRLACPVCNHRDKSCILLRCRHMFCKPCVDENVKNRSRKCPACGQRFDNKDVADVWL